MVKSPKEMKKRKFLIDSDILLLHV